MKKSGALTSEGNAVLLMLIATRSHEEMQDGLGLDWIGANRGFIPHTLRKEAAGLIKERENGASRMRNRFAVDQIDECPVVKLISFKITDEILLRSTIWSMSWDDGDRHARDCFYLWMLQRIDRWEDWTEIVERSGTKALTEHLMKLAFALRIQAICLGRFKRGTS